MKDGLLEVGDVFTSGTLGYNVAYKLDSSRDAPPRINRKVLEVCPWSKKETTYWIERNSEGWERRQEVTVDLDAKAVWHGN